MKLFQEQDANIRSLDPLKFTATANYKDKIKQNQKKTNETDTVISGKGTIHGMPVILLSWILDLWA